MAKRERDDWPRLSRKVARDVKRYGVLFRRRMSAQHARMARLTRQQTRDDERRLARRILRLAVTRAERNGQPSQCQIELWRIVVKMSHVAAKGER